MATIKVVFSVDFEGATGIVSTKEIFEGGLEFGRGKEYLTHDTNAAIVGAFEAGVTGDDVACSQMKRFIPEIETAVVKQAISRYAATCPPLSRTEVLMREAAKRALIRVSKNEIPPYRYQGEKAVEIDLRTPYQAAVISELTKAERVAPCTIGYAAADVLDVYRFRRLALYLVKSSLIP